MNPTQRLLQVEIDRIIAVDDAKRKMREAQRILVEHLNQYPEEAMLVEPMELLTSSILKLKEVCT